MSGQCETMALLCTDLYFDELTEILSGATRCNTLDACHISCLKHAGPKNDPLNPPRYQWITEHADPQLNHGSHALLAQSCFSSGCWKLFMDSKNTFKEAYISIYCHKPFYDEFMIKKKTWQTLKTTTYWSTKGIKWCDWWTDEEVRPDCQRAEGETYSGSLLPEPRVLTGAVCWGREWPCAEVTQRSQKGQRLKNWGLK